MPKLLLWAHLVQDLIHILIVWIPSIIRVLIIPVQGCKINPAIINTQPQNIERNENSLFCLRW
jgi:hypothetical protein